MPAEKEENKPAQNITTEGAKVTEGEENNANQGSGNSTENANAEGTELQPQSDTKKEDMTSYNEHPDQEKVGGG